AEAAPLAVDALDRAEQLLDDVEAVDAEVAEGISRAAVPRRERAALVRRPLGAAEGVDRDDLPELARSDGVERAFDLRVEKERVVHADDEVLLLREVDDLATLGLVLGDRLLDEDVAAALECLERDRHVRGRRREDVDHVRSGVDERVER